MNHELQRLMSVSQQVMDEARRLSTRPKYDGHRLIEEGKRRRRRLLSEVARYGIGQL